MDEQKFKKILKDVKWSSIILLVLVLILFFINIAAGTLSGLSTMSIILQIVLLLGTIVVATMKCCMDLSVELLLLF